VLGVYLFTLFRELGQIELVVNGSYVVLLGSIGGLMLNESIKRSARRARQSASAGQGASAPLDPRLAAEDAVSAARVSISA
jgi:hypothetical protein